MFQTCILTLKSNCIIKLFVMQLFILLNCWLGQCTEMVHLNQHIIQGQKHCFMASWGSSPTELTSINTVKQEQDQTAKTQPVPTFGWKFKGANHKPELGKWFTTQDGSNGRLRLNPFYTNSLPLEASQKMTIRCSPGFMSNSCWAAPLYLPSSQPRILRQVIQNRWQLHVGRLETFCLNFICVLMNLISVFFWHSQFDLFELWF